MTEINITEDNLVNNSNFGDDNPYGANDPEYEDPFKKARELDEIH